jgi:hypothetical protein
MSNFQRDFVNELVTTNEDAALVHVEILTLDGATDATSKGSGN